MKSILTVLALLITFAASAAAGGHGGGGGFGGGAPEPSGIFTLGLLAIGLFCRRGR